MHLKAFLRKVPFPMKKLLISNLGEHSGSIKSVLRVGAKYFINSLIPTFC